VRRYNRKVKGAGLKAADTKAEAGPGSVALAINQRSM